MSETQNPFGDMSLTTQPQGSTAVADVSIQREIAEVQGAIILARKFPRNQLRAMDRILNACQRPTLASNALYSYNRGGSDITGPSIRLAEAIAQNWENLQFGIRELEQRSNESTVEAYAWDLETNVRQSKIFQVPHVRYSKNKGKYALSDPRDVYEMVANQGARRLRACILGVIPGDVIEAAVEQVEKTLKANVAVTTETVKAMLEKFSEFGVTKEQIEKRIQRHIDSIQPAQFISLRKIYTSIKDGMSSAADWFESVETERSDDKPVSGAEAAKDAIRKAKKQTREQSPSVHEQPAPDSVLDDDTPLDEGEPLICPDSGNPTTVGFCNSRCVDRKDCKAFA